MKVSSKNRLMPIHADLFNGDSLFHRIARTVCRAGVLPRKELYEAWETARRVRRRFRGGRVVDMACGHGLLAHIMLLLDRSSVEAVAVDTALPPSAGKLAGVMAEAWPRLRDQVRYVSGDLEEVPLSESDIVVSAHACGSLTDTVITRAVSVRARVAVLPCCHDLKTCRDGGLSGWMAGDLAVDAYRAMGLTGHGYDIHTAVIPSDVTPKNRLLMGWPSDQQD
ncbi:MAG TPA: methyltransferase domain-containing protein [Desulfobacteraceae bacterium]|nr:methyltransferase domain-containing protein [Desulfobacteraceae bacterium]